MKTWLSILCPSCRPNDLDNWLDSLYANCVDPKDIELSLTVEQSLSMRHFDNWGNIKITQVVHGQYNINQLVEICYKQSSSPWIFLSGDDSICHTKRWDSRFKEIIDNFKDNIILVYPNDLIFGKELACYPVTSREIMDSVPWPVPYKRYAIDDTIFDIVPQERRFYLEDVVMEHLHLVDEGPGKKILKDGKVKYYPIDPEVMKTERPLFESLKSERDEIRYKHYLTMHDGKPPSKILIGVSTQELARQSVFYDYVNAIERPIGTITSYARGQSPAEARNNIIQQALDHNCSHILFLDDDMAVRPNILRKLWAHNKDVVSAIYLKRQDPHIPLVFDQVNENGHFSTIDLNGKDLRGLIKITGAGFGCCLIKTHVFRKMEKPWVRLGELKADGWCDDTGFFFRLHKLGIECYCDLDAKAGHMANVTIWPEIIDDKWMVRYDTGGLESVTA